MDLTMYRRTKLWVCAFALLTCFFFAAGCGGTSQEGEKTSETKTVTDLTGAEVKIKKDPQRMVVVPVPWASIVYAVDGSSEKLVGMHPSAMAAYKKSMLRKMAPKMAEVNDTFVDRNFNVNYEEIAKLRPDLAVIWDYQPEVAEKLNGMGIPAVKIRYGTLEDVQKGIALLGDILNKQEEANALIAYHKESEAYFKEKAKELEGKPRPKVLYLQNEQLTAAGTRSVNKIMIEAAGGENVVDVEDQWPKITMEQVMSWNPDVIILSNFSDFTPEDIYRNAYDGQDWSNLDAVKNRRVYKAPLGIYRWDAPCVETPLMMRWLGKVLHPEVFGDYEMRPLLTDFYRKYFHYELQQEDLDEILQTKWNAALAL